MVGCRSLEFDLKTLTDSHVLSCIGTEMCLSKTIPFSISPLLTPENDNIEIFATSPF
jgi:hypothetical protein